jgi:hypothetical protein
MRSITTAFVLVSGLLLGGHAVAADNPPSYIGKYTSTPQDTAAINKVIEDFKTALKTKDLRLLSSLVLNSNILFDAPLGPEAIAHTRSKIDVNFNGLRNSGYNDFARFIASSKEPVEEKFYNVKITQDKNVAWVMFDYEFLVGGKAENYGIETWQMMKVADNSWKIASVMWTMNPLQ